MEKDTYLSERSVGAVKELFSNEDNYNYHMDNLNKTRQGLAHIMETKRDLTQLIYPQFETINRLIYSLKKLNNEFDKIH